MESGVLSVGNCKMEDVPCYPFCLDIGWIFVHSWTYYIDNQTSWLCKKKFNNYLGNKLQRILVRQFSTKISTCPNFGFIHHAFNINFWLMCSHDHHFTKKSPSSLSLIVFSFGNYFQIGERQLRNRKKAIKMLVMVVLIFAISYLPVHLHNIATWVPFPCFPKNYICLFLFSNIDAWLTKNGTQKNTRHGCTRRPRGKLEQWKLYSI